MKKYCAFFSIILSLSIFLGSLSFVYANNISLNDTLEINKDILTTDSALEIDEDENYDNELPDQTNFKENSWRYVNGENVLQNQEVGLADAGAWAEENGKFYNDIGEVIEGATMKGIDVSKHQGVIDWNEVKNTDVDYAIIRCGFGDNISSQDDSQWTNNANACTSLNIPFGVYIYSYALSTTQARSEAEHVLRLVDGYNLSFPIYLDMEDNTQSGLSASELGNIAKTFCDTIQGAGYEVGIYANKYWWTSKLTSSVFDNSSWHKWVAQYNSNCTYSGDYEMWQATSSGNVDGISGNVDIDFYFGSTTGSLEDNIIDYNIKDLDKNGYTVYITFNDSSNISQVLFPTKYENGEWDWLETTSKNGNTYSCWIDVNNWGGKEGNYTTHIYAYDDFGNVVGLPCSSRYIDRTGPTISDIKVVKSTTGYTITCTVKDTYGLSRVQFPTWTTANDQDDVISDWVTNSKASGTKNGDVYTYNVKYSDHNDEQGFYNTHIYAYDKYGNCSLASANGGNYYKYTVSYNANGGNGVSGNQTKVYKVDLKLSTTKPTRNGYTFVGWGTSANATSATYQPGGTYSDNTNITLYAIWTANKYTVSYNANGGSGAPANQIKTHGTNLILSTAKPIREGYTFVGWGTTTNAISATYQSGATYSNNANITLYAVWDKEVVSDTGVNLKIENVTGTAGGYIDIPVKIENNTGISCFEVILKYDNQVMYPISYTKGSKFSDMISNLDSGTDLTSLKEIRFVWDSLSDVTDNGNLFVVKFKINSNVATGTYSIDIDSSKSMLANIKLEDVMFNVTSGIVTISDTLKGDVNGDGTVNGKDVVLLRQYIAGWPSANLTTEQLNASDVTGDEATNGKDVVKIRQYIAGWPGVKL